MKLEFGLDKAIFVWDYDHLPDEIKKFMEEQQIPNDDIDWIAIKPEIYEWVNWLEEPIFGCCSVKEYPLGTMGHKLVLGYHS